MTKRFTDDGIEEIENQSFTDNLTEKTYWIDNGLDEIVDLLNAFHEENVKLRARNKYLATKIQRERNIHVKEHEKWEKEIQKENEQLKEDNMLLIEDSEKYRKLSIQFDNRNKELISENEQLKLLSDAVREELGLANRDNTALERENEQLKTTISRLIEQNRKNNDLLVSDIRLLEKALWCPNCTINIKRLRELKKEFEK